jgi:hypothetical protein
MAVSRLSETTLQNAFQKFNNVWDGLSAVGAMDAIPGAQILQANASSVVMSSIPQTYTHLQLRAFVKTNRAVTYDSINLRANSDTGGNYAAHEMSGDGRPYISVGGSGGATSAYVARVPGAPDAHPGKFGIVIIDILDYTNTDKHKTFRSIYGYDLALGESNIGGINGMNSGVWRSTAAINSLTIRPESGTALLTYSNFALYGIK